ncbi:MAG: hypothetical protein C0518_16210 [Opitutus sp.]|nr:hypothetical protein [Opitutus sp.]
MKKSHLILAALSLAALSPFVHAQGVTLPNASPRATVSQIVGITKVGVDYSRPSVNNRPVWGQLVPYGFNNLGFGTSTAAPWRAGADMNTVVTFEHDVKVGGQPLAAGSYGLSMAVADTGKVTLIFSRDTHKWGSFFYEPANDALRVETQWEDAPHMEQLAYEFSDVKKDSAVLALRWEKKRIPIALAFDTDAIVVANLKRELRGNKQFQFQSWLGASNYLLTNNGDLNLALEWADAAIAGQFVGQRNFATVSNKVAVLEKMGRGTEAEPLYAELMNTGTALQVHGLGRQLLAAGKKERALAVFKKNAERHPGVWPTNYGLARGLSAMGEYPAALEALLKAQQEIPAGDTVNANAIKANIEKLKAGQDIN